MGLFRWRDEDRMTTDIGSNLRAIRGRRGLSQEELRRKADVREKTVGDIENGEILKPQAGTLYRLSKALDVTVFELTRDAVAPPSES